MAYISQEQKKAMANKLKAIKPDGWRWSLSIRNYSEIILTIQKGSADLAVREGKAVDHKTLCHPSLLKKYYSGETLEVLEQVVEILYEGNHDNSDIMTDYFDVGWYVTIQAGKWDRPFIAIPVAEKEAEEVKETVATEETGEVNEQAVVETVSKQEEVINQVDESRDEMYSQIRELEETLEERDEIIMRLKAKLFDLMEERSGEN